MSPEKNLSFPFITFSVLTAIALLLLSSAIWMAKDTYEHTSASIEKNHELMKARENILLYDEVLTMSASMAARTGDARWIERFNEYEPLLMQAIEQALNAANGKAISNAISSTERANSVLIQMEKKSFDLVKQGDLQAAWKIISSEEYKTQKKIYAKGIKDATDALRNETAQYIESSHSRLFYNLIGSIIAFAVMVLIWLIVWNMVKNWQTIQLKHQKKLNDLATHDELTGLPNRTLLINRLKQAVVQEQRRHMDLAVVFIDLDGFKPVNDQYGHAIGDRLLQMIANRLKLTVRQGDTVSRFGGDEFVIMLMDIENETSLKELLERIQTDLKRPILIDDYKIEITSSLGVSICHCKSYIEAEQLIRQADHAMYQAKKQGKNRYMIFPENEQQGNHKPVLIYSS